MEDRIEDLLSRYQQGDASAVDPLVDTLSPLLRRFFLGLGAGHDDAGDLVQETWLRLHKARHTYRPGAPALPWIYAIARHTRLDRLRKQIRVQKREIAMDVLPDAPQVLAPEETVDVEELLQHLPEAQREAVVMTKLNGLSLEETARATGTSVGSVKQKVFRAYEKLRALAQERGRQ